MKRPIVTDIKFLKQISEPATFGEAKGIIKDLEDSLDLDKGIGLSAIQIGIPKQVGIIRIHGLKINLINPKIIEKEIKFRHQQERCLSLPGLRIDTIRFKKIIIENLKTRTYEGVEAIAVQHEVDHMKGILITNRKWKKRK